jgi:hypothetical protein
MRAETRRRSTARSNCSGWRSILAAASESGHRRDGADGAEAGKERRRRGGFEVWAATHGLGVSSFFLQIFIFLSLLFSFLFREIEERGWVP